MPLRRLSLLLLCCCLLASPAAWGADLNLRFQALQNDYARLLRSEKERLYRQNWERVISAFETFSQQHPDHEKGPAALFMAGRASQGLYRFSRRNGDAGRAAQLFDRLGNVYSCHNLADDALVMAAEIHEEILGDKAGAIERYQKVARDYAKGDQVYLARKRLEALGAAPSASEVIPRPAPPTQKKAASGPARIGAIRHFGHGDFSRVVVDLDASVDFAFNLLPPAAKGGETRLYVDLKGVAFPSGSLGQGKIDDPHVRRIRLGRPEPGKTRVVLDLKLCRDYRVYPLDNPARVVIEVAGSKQSWDQTDAAFPDVPPGGKEPVAAAPPAAGNNKPAPGTPGRGKDELSSLLEKKAAAQPCPLVSLPSLSAKKGPRCIVVDPGHGGKDPGAIGPDGIQEKDVVLSIGKRLARRLREELRCEVVMTRDKDVFIPLKERAAIANRVNADLFISIHANASLNRKSHGVETYYLNFSKNESAASVAARENGTTLAEVGDLELILFDLMAHAKINESSLLADKVQKGIISSLTGHYRNIHDNGVRQGPFYVLLGANMPSILVETAFISNPRDESRLQSDRYQNGVVDGIVAGVKNFDNTLNRMAKR
jgi:N-acetylmuramoyl-L-alanine amidase